MSWPIPPSAQWNTGIAMSSNMNLGFTPEQWALMQQQNWQQWSQWQQQYSQWQSQYGEKYAEQMHSMGMVPPLPPMSCAPPPAPPPPDQPPPPHQNDQPLYDLQKPPPPPVPVPVPVPAPAPPSAPPSAPAQLSLPPPALAPTPTQVLNKPDNVNKTKTSSNPQNWSYATDICNDMSQNTEALEQLSEEERFFDIQFQKWEKQIEKWKEENANHPDKKAYSEYEQKFEACRAQLLERRQQMKQKRARLTSSTTQIPNSAVAGNTISSAIPAVQIVNRNYSPTNLQSQKFNSNQSGNGSNQKNSHYPYYNVSQPSYSNENKLDQQYRNDSYQSAEPYSCGNMDKSNFLPTKEALKGIPGLDLVPEVEKISHNKQQDVIDIMQEKFTEKQLSNLKGPDYSTISQGINNILGDEKIMNILSMVRGQQSFDSADANRQSNNFHNIINDKQQLSTPPPSMRQNIPYNPQNAMAFPRQDIEHSVQRTSYDQSQKNILMEPHYINYSHNIAHNPTSKNMSHIEQPIQNQSIQNSLENLPRDNHARRAIADQTMCPAPGQSVRSKWIEDPLFTPSVIVDYEHKPLRLKARDFIEPVHVFDYNHKSKETDYKKKDFEKEVDELFFRQPPKKELDDDGFVSEKFHRDLHYRDYEKKPRDYTKEDYRQRVPLREEYVERRRYEDKYDDRKKDDSDKYRRREDIYRDREKDWEKGRDRDEYNRDRYRDYRKDDNRNRSRSKEKENRKRDHSKESDSDRGVNTLKKAKATNKNDITLAKHIVMIDDILESPGREMRPDKIVIILRGLPGSGKSYLAKLIRDKEAEHGGTVRIMSLDDYFMQEGEIEVNDPVTGKVVKKPSLKYEYDPEMEESYLHSLKRAFKRSLTDGYFSFLIFDAVNEQLKSYADVWNFARQNGFQVYICTMEADVATCHKRNIHNRSLDEIKAMKCRFFSTPAHHIQLDPTTLLQSAAITEVQMEDADDGVTMEDTVETEVENHFTSKWEKMDDAAQLARLDGTSKPLRPSQLSMEDYLQIDDWKPNVAKPGKKTVRWADIEERRQQEKMRAIGFVVGQTDWNRMTDPTMGSSALTQTKYIERVRRM